MYPFLRVPLYINGSCRFKGFFLLICIPFYNRSSITISICILDQGQNGLQIAGKKRKTEFSFDDNVKLQIMLFHKFTLQKNKAKSLCGLRSELKSLANCL